MIRLVPLSLLLTALMGSAAMAAEPSVCTSLCSEQKNVCRKQAQRSTELDSNPLIGTAPRNSDERTLAKLQDGTLEQRGRERSDFQKRKSERDSACNDSYLRCSAACSAPVPAAGESSVVIKRR